MENIFDFTRPNAMYIRTCIGNFIFSEDIHNFRVFNNELRRNCWTEFDDGLAYDLDEEELSVEKLSLILLETVWDECVDTATYNMPLKYYTIFENVNVWNEGAIMQRLLMLSGDVETNPGPNSSHPVEYRNNDPRTSRLEKVIEKQDKKIKDLIRQLRREIKNNRIHTQGMFGIPDTSTVKDVNDNLSRMCDFLENALPAYVNAFSKGTKNVLDIGQNVKNDLVSLVVISLVIKLLMSMKHNKLALIIILGFIVKFYGIDKSVLDYIAELRASVSKEEEQHASTQGFSDVVEACVYHPYFDICGKILFSVMAFICIRQIPGKKDWDNYLTRLDKIPKAKKGAKEIIDYCGEYFNAANDTIKMMVLGKNREELQRANGIYHEIHEWAQEVRKYLDLEQRNKIDLDINIANKVEDLYKRGLKYQSDTLLDREISRLVSTTLLPARELYQYVSCSPVKGGGPRMRPICLWLVGESGVGKTEMVYPLCIDILREMGLTGKQDFHHQVYGRQVETEFWDGYKGQKIVIYDDAFQMKDDKTSPNPEIFEVIRSCNTFPQHLHMAALHDKNTYSQAELLLYTTNNYNISLESITFPDAFYNRMGDHAYKVRPRPEYSVLVKKPNSTEMYRKLDKSKLNTDKAIDLDAYEFQKIVKDVSNDAEWIEQGEPLNYEQFSKFICSEWKKEKQQSLNKLKFLEQYATRIEAQIGTEDKEEFQDAFDEPYFENDIARRIASGETLIDIEAYYAESKAKYDAYIDWKKKNVKPDIWAKYRYRLDMVLSDVQNYLDKLKAQIKEIIVNHPYLTILGFVGMAIAAFSLYKTFEHFLNKPKEIKENSSVRFVERPIVEVGTSGDAKTNKQHIKRVEAKFSQEVYEKDRKEMKQLATSLYKRMPCDKKDEFLDKLDEIFENSGNDDDLPMSDEDFKKMLNAEVGTSGDVKTNKQQIKRIEAKFSKDVKAKEVDEMKLLAMKLYKQMPNDKKEEFLAEVDKIFEDDEQENKESIADDSDYLTAALGKHVDVQGLSDGAAHNLVTDVLRRNTYRLSYFRNGKRIPFGNCTFVKGWCFVIPYHFLHALHARKLPSDTIINFSQVTRADIIQIELSHIIIDDGDYIQLTDNCVRLVAKNGDKRDCVMVNLHAKMCHPHRDLCKHFVRTSDQGRLIGRFNGVLATFHEIDDELARAYQWLTQIRPFDKEIIVHYPDDGYDYKEEYFTQRDCYEYNAPTQVGDCGSLIGLYNHRLERKIIGMHIAGTNQEYGYACPLTQDILEDAFRELEAKQLKNVSAQFYFEVDEAINTETVPLVPEGLFVPIGKAPKAVGQAIRTTLVPSKLYGKISEPFMKPALLKPTTINGVFINPLMKGLKKCGVATAVISDLDVLSASQDVCQVVLTRYNSGIDISKYQRILTYEEAIKGTSDDDYMCAVNRTTSPGYPYSLEKKEGPGKTYWMGQGEKFEFNTIPARRLRRDVEKLLENCSNGIISGVVFIDTLKDERREIKKVEAGKTRVFSAGPQHFVVAFRQYFLPFAAFLMHNRIDNEICVGSNPYSLDWERIARKLKLKGEHVIAGDFGNFDGSLVAQILWSIFWEIYVPWLQRFNDFSTPEGQIILRTCLGLWTHLVHSVHIFKDNVYMWTHSQPSGNPFTVIINCLYNSIIMRLAWIEIMKEVKPEYMSMKFFRKHVSMVSFGDDNVLNISERVLDLYNQETISEVMTKLKHEYTDEAKTGQIIKSRKLEDIFFLKRGFKFSEELQRTIAPLKIEVIYEMLNWSRNTIDPDVILMTNIEVAMREIVYHGREEYTKLKNKILKLADCLPEYPQILTYEQYLHDIRYLADPIYEF